MDSNIPRNQDTKILIFITLILVTIGVIMVYSSTTFSHNTLYLKKQVLLVAIGLISMFIVSKIDYHIWHKYSFALFLITVFLLLIVLQIGEPVRGVRRWIRLGSFSFQPSELAKLLTIIYISSFIVRKGAKIKNLKYGFVPIVLIFFVIFCLMILEPSFGVVSVLSLSFIAVLFIGDTKVGHLIPLVIGGAIIFIFALYHIPYAKERMSEFRTQESYQVRQSIMGIGSGGFIGVGLGNSKEKLLFLPEPHTDFIFSIISEEFGFMGSMSVFFLFVLLFLRSMKIAKKSQDKFGCLLASGIGFIIFISVILHIGVTSGIIPTTGIPLPFVSAGGTALVVNLIGIGILLNISKTMVDSRQSIVDRL